MDELVVLRLLEGVHLAAASEAMVLGAKAGLRTDVLYDIISNAAGSSRMFAKGVPRMLRGDFAPQNPLDTVIDSLDGVVAAARQLRFPLPLTSAAHQQFLSGSLAGRGAEDAIAVVKVYETMTGVSVAPGGSAAPGGQSEGKGTDAEGVVASVRSGPRPKRVGFIGLGAMGLGMASALVKDGLSVCGFDVWEPSMQKFRDAGGETATTPGGAAKGSDVLVIMVTNAEQAESVCYGLGGSVADLPDSAAVILCSTVPPDFVRSLEKRLLGEGRGLMLVDAPVSGGVVRAAEGKLTIMAAGSDAALLKAGAVLAVMSERLHIIEGGAGAGSSVKMVNQHLAGVHIAATAEALVFAARGGLNTRHVYDTVSNSDATSWMFENRAPHMIDNDFTPHSALDIFVKDLGIVLGEAKGLRVPLPLAAAAHQQFLAGSAMGHGRIDDAGVVKLYEHFSGATVASPVSTSAPAVASSAPRAAWPPCSLAVLVKEEVLASLPPDWGEDPLEEIRLVEGSGGAATMVVLDDDPTGTQTVHGVAVLTEWSVESIRAELAKRVPCFFILTNSRALPTAEAEELTRTICTNVAEAAKLAGGAKFTVILRGDSTLRGHFPQEADVAQEVVGATDAWLLAPFFAQGGRLTIADVHYVATADKLVPAGQTQFAKDAAFGYRSSNLKQWVEEKTCGRVSASDVASISLDTIRNGGPAAVCSQLCALHEGVVCIVNAASDRDMAVFAAGMIRAEKEGKHFLCRTAASFVSARLGLTQLPPLSPADLGIRPPRSGQPGGLIVVGSYVPMTTAQLEELHTSCGSVLATVVVDAASVSAEAGFSREREITRAATTAEAALRGGTDTVLMTSRTLVTAATPADSLAIGGRVSSALVEIVTRITTRPRFIIAKGGITSSDIATKALRASRAEVVGQAYPGVPLWQLGEGSRHPGLPYIVFPGNVGGPDALATVVKVWSSNSSSNISPPNGTLAILKAASAGGYSVGAFNVYNLEGVKAVVDAAESQRSPAILQIHPSAFKHGGHALLGCCVAAAQNAKVPISVHLDHGTDEAEIMAAMETGFHSVMVDGSHLSYEENVALTRRVAAAAHSRGLSVEAELGRLSGTEDGITVEEWEGKLTDVAQARDFLVRTGVDALAVCVGNVHGKYPPGPPKIDMDRLKELRRVADECGAILVLHGASGLPPETVEECIASGGIRKFNVNTEVRAAYLGALVEKKKDILDYLQATSEAMKVVVLQKLRMFGSVDQIL